MLTSPPMAAAQDSAESYMRWRRAVESAPMAQQILQTVRPFAVRPPLSWRVLDIGSGTGHTAAGLAPHTEQVIGLEPSPSLLDEARRTWASVNNLRFEQRGFEQIHERDEFDLVVLDNVLEHLPDQRGALLAIEAALREGGIAYVVVPNRVWPVEHHYLLPFLGWLPLR